MRYSQNPTLFSDQALMQGRSLKSLDYLLLSRGIFDEPQNNDNTCAAIASHCRSRLWHQIIPESRSILLGIDTSTLLNPCSIPILHREEAYQFQSLIFHHEEEVAAVKTCDYQSTLKCWKSDEIPHDILVVAFDYNGLDASLHKILAAVVGYAVS